MKILYIDNRRYGHNKDLHIDFISYMHNKKYHRVIGYGKYLNHYLQESIIPDTRRVSVQLDKVIARYKPDCILTYNCNGSSYEIGHDNVAHYMWVSEYLSRLDIPKFHVTTDYCRSGYRKDQAKWFKDVGYSAALFRHRVALKYDLKVPKYWLPFSVNKNLYLKNILKDMDKKKESVGFLGAAHNSSRELYKIRIAAIDFLKKRDLLTHTKVLDSKFRRKILLGEDYVRFMSKNMFNLTCGGTCNFMTAKYFQIPASYSMLVCSNTDGLDIFPKDTYILYDKNNLKKMLNDLKFHINNKDIALSKIEKLHNFVINNHDHHTRILEMTEIFKRHI